MGNSQSSCSLCSDDSVKKRVEVIVMKEDGESMTYREGTRVYDILAAHPYHKMIRCCTDRSVLPDDFILNCNSLYFLLPEGLSVCDATYRSLVKSAMSKELLIPKAVRPVPECDEISCNINERLYEEHDDHDSGFRNKSTWTPGLKTIPEVKSGPSPPLHAPDPQA